MGAPSSASGSPPGAAPAGSACRGQKVELTLGPTTEDPQYLPGSGQDSGATGRALRPRAESRLSQQLGDFRICAAAWLRRPPRPSPGRLIPGVLCGGRAELTITNPAAAATRPFGAPAASGAQFLAGALAPRAEPGT
ncbi:hypothetical protein NN561_003243 [Cricetulus griseus]